MNRVRISNSSLNSYGTRILTSGVDIRQYERNPVLLYMHQRGTVVGYIKDLRVEGDDITGEPVFDEATPLSQQLKKQMEVGSIRMVSATFEIQDMSDDPALIVEGQTSPTVTRSRLFEVSVVDIGSNDDALVLMHQGRRLTLAEGGGNPLPLLKHTENNTTLTPSQQQQQQTKTEESMDIKQIALAVGLEETADETAVMKKLGELSLAAQQVQALQQEKELLTLSAITASVDTAIKEQRIDAQKKQQFINLGKQIGNEQLQQIFQAMHPQVKLSALLNHQGGTGTQNASWQKLSDVPADQLLSLKADNPALYHQLYKAEYGQDF